MDLQNVERKIEASILSSILFNGTMDELNQFDLKEYYFSIPQYRDIYNAMLKLAQEDKPIDETFLLKDLGKNYEPHLVNILSSNPIVLSQHYIDILKNSYMIERMKKFNLGSLKDINENVNIGTLKDNLYSFVETLESAQESSLFESFNYDPNKKEQVKFISTEFLPFPEKTVSMITAGGGTGKSWLILNFAVREANKGKKVFAWMSEDPIGETMNRIHVIIHKVLKNINEEKVKQNLVVTDSNTFHVIDKQAKVSYKFYELKQALRKYDIIILDPLIAFYGSDENDNADARVFMQLFTQWAAKEDKVIIFIHHSTKGTSQSRGASAIVDAVRLVYEVEKIENDLLHRQIKLTKDNYNTIKNLDKSPFERKLFPSKVVEVKNITPSLLYSKD